MLFWNGKRKFKVVCDYCLTEYDTIGDPRNEYNKSWIKMYVRTVNEKTLFQVCCKPVDKVEISSIHILKWYMKKYQLLDEGWKIVNHAAKNYVTIFNFPSTTYI